MPSLVKIAAFLICLLEQNGQISFLFRSSKNRCSDILPKRMIFCAFLSAVFLPAPFLSWCLKGAYSFQYFQSCAGGEEHVAVANLRVTEVVWKANWNVKPRVSTKGPREAAEPCGESYGVCFWCACPGQVEVYRKQRKVSICLLFPWGRAGLFLFYRWQMGLFKG